MRAVVNGVTVEGTVAELRELLGIGNTPIYAQPLQQEERRAEVRTMTLPQASLEQALGSPMTREETVGLLRRLLGLGEESLAQAPVQQMPVQQAPRPQQAISVNQVNEAPPGTAIAGGQSGRVEGNVVRIAQPQPRLAGDGTGPKGNSTPAPNFGGLNPAALMQLADNEGPVQQSPEAIRRALAGEPAPPAQRTLERPRRPSGTSRRRNRE